MRPALYARETAHLSDDAALAFLASMRPALYARETELRPLRRSPDQAASMRPALYARETGARCNPRHGRLVSHHCERSSQLDRSERSHVLDPARA